MRPITFPRQDEGTYLNSETGVKIRRHAGPAQGLWVVIRPNRRDGLLYTATTSLAKARREAVAVVEAVRIEIAQAYDAAELERTAREMDDDELHASTTARPFSSPMVPILIAEIARRAAARPVEYGPIDKAAILRKPPIDSLLDSAMDHKIVKAVNDAATAILDSLARPFTPTAVYPLRVTIEQYTHNTYRVMLPTPNVIREAWSSATPSLDDARRQAEKAVEFMRNLRNHDHIAAIAERREFDHACASHIEAVRCLPDHVLNALVERWGDTPFAGYPFTEEVARRDALDAAEVDRAAEIANARRVALVHGTACPYGGCDSCDPTNAEIDEALAELRGVVTT